MNDMPQRLWITKETSYQPTLIRSFSASDLDHGPEYPQYVRLDIVHRLLVALQDFKDQYDPLDLIYDEPAAMSDAYIRAENVIKQTKEILNEG